MAFVGYAQRDGSGYTKQVADGFRPLAVEVSGVHTASNPRDEIMRAEAIYVGGGNTFRLVDALHRHNLIDAIRERVVAGIPYMGESAGSIVPCPSIRTSNDMPVVEPVSFASLGLLPFQINPHYIPGVADPQFMGETRDERIMDYLDEEGLPVLAMREGSWLRVDGSTVNLDGSSGARLFRRGDEAQEVLPGTDLSWLLAETETALPPSSRTGM